MQIPDALLSARLPAAAKTVLAALWRDAAGEPAWAAPRITDLAAAVGMSISHVKEMLAVLIDRGAVRRETRDAHGRRRLRGFGLSRTVTPLRGIVRRAAPTTPPGQTRGVVKRERDHKLTIEDDMRAIARVAGRGDSEVRIADLLLRKEVPCSSGRWHNIKVRRRIDRMREEMGVTAAGLRAGDVVARWRAQAEAVERRRTAARDAAVPDARISFRDDADEPRRGRA